MRTVSCIAITMALVAAAGLGLSGKPSNSYPLVPSFRHLCAVASYARIASFPSTRGSKYLKGGM